MKKLLLALLFFPTLAFANPIDDKCPQHVKWGAPQFSVSTENVQYLCRTGYAVAYSNTYKNPLYVAEHVSKDRIGEEPRTEDFRPDTEIKPENQATLQDYTGAGYDRGHMSPAANNGSNKQAMSESFLLTNMVPQNPGNNRGIWKQLEVFVRDWVVKGNDLYVIQGAIFDKGHKTIGKNVAVPTRLFKVVVDPTNKRMIAFIFPNEKLEVKDMPKYVVSVQKVEQETHIDFSPMIPGDLKIIEINQPDTKSWSGIQ
jgi:endonuclease G